MGKNKIMIGDRVKYLERVLQCSGNAEESPDFFPFYGRRNVSLCVSVGCATTCSLFAVLYFKSL